MGLELVDGPETVHGAEHPEVDQVVVAPGEVEQAEAVAHGERIQVEGARRARDSSLRHPHSPGRP